MTVHTVDILLIGPDNVDSTDERANSWELRSVRVRSYERPGIALAPESHPLTFYKIESSLMAKFLT